MALGIPLFLDTLTEYECERAGLPSNPNNDWIEPERIRERLSWRGEQRAELEQELEKAGLGLDYSVPYDTGCILSIEVFEDMGVIAIPEYTDTFGHSYFTPSAMTWYDGVIIVDAYSDYTDERRWVTVVFTCQGDQWEYHDTWEWDMSRVIKE